MGVNRVARSYSAEAGNHSSALESTTRVHIRTFHYLSSQIRVRDCLPAVTTIGMVLPMEKLSYNQSTKGDEAYAWHTS